MSVFQHRGSCSENKYRTSFVLTPAEGEQMKQLMYLGQHKVKFNPIDMITALEKILENHGYKE